MPKWVKKGECNHCGYCCIFAVNKSRLFIKNPSDRDREFLITRGFKSVIRSEGVGLEIISDSYVPCPQHINNRCNIYDKRPEACKLFPEHPGQVAGTPCSYWFEDEEGKEKPVGGDASPYATKFEHYRDLLELKAKMQVVQQSEDPRE